MATPAEFVMKTRLPGGTDIHEDPRRTHLAVLLSGILIRRWFTASAVLNLKLRQYL